MINADLIVNGQTNRAFTNADKTKLDAGGATAIKRGIAVRDDAAKFLGIPDTGFTAASSIALVAGQTYYVPFLVKDTTRTLTDWSFLVGTGPASAANVRHGIYAADGDKQPSGNPLFDTGSVAVASAFTGVKTGTLSSIALAPGRYLQAFTMDVAMTIRCWVSPAFDVHTGLASTALGSRFYVAAAYAALPSPGTKWSTFDQTSTGLTFPILYKWTE